MFSAALAVNKKLFIPLRNIAHFSFSSSLSARKSAPLRGLSATHREPPVIRHNNSDEVEIPSFTGLFSPAWSMTPVCGRPGFYHFLMDEQLLYPSAAVPPPSISFSFVHIFCAPLRFSPSPLGYSSVSLPIPPSQWLCGIFLHLCYVMALRGRGHFNQYFKQPGPPGGLAPNATWQHDRMTFEEGGERQPRNTYCCQRCSDLRLGGGNGARTLMRAIRDHWREEEILGGESKNNELIKTHSLGDTSPGWFICLTEIKARRINRNRIIHTVASEGQQNFTFKRVAKWHTLCLG